VETSRVFSRSEKKKKKKVPSVTRGEELLELDVSGRDVCSSIAGSIGGEGEGHAKGQGVCAPLSIYSTCTRRALYVVFRVGIGASGRKI